MPSRLPVPDLLARLVAFDTTSRNSNLPLVDFVCDYLDRPGTRITRHPAPEEAKANVVVEVGPEVDPATREGLVLSGHTDVVPAEEPGWTSDPFVLTERDGVFYGRGTADMKGFLALALDVAAGLDPTALQRPLVVLLTYDEELGTLGARHFRETWPADRPLPRQAVIGEPTELAVVRLHKGHLKCRWELLGKPAHSAYPHLGRNAIEPAAELVRALTRLRETLETERLASSAYFAEVPFASLNVARIAGGAAVNVVPERCVVEVGLRLLPGMEVDATVERLREAGRPSLSAIEHRFEVLSVSPPMEAPAEAPILRRLLALNGQADPDRSVMFATDAGWFQEMGMECAIWGPGSIEVAHKPNERLDRGELERARGLLDSLERNARLEAA